MQVLSMLMLVFATVIFARFLWGYAHNEGIFERMGDKWAGLFGVLFLVGMFVCGCLAFSVMIDIILNRA